MKLTLSNVVKAGVSIEEKFDFLYDCTEKVLSKYNPCKISFLKSGVNCIDCKAGFSNPNDLCCTGCRFHTDKGCVANKPLTCKLYLCRTATKKFPNCVKELNDIYACASFLRLLSFRGDKKDSIKSGFSCVISSGCS